MDTLKYTIVKTDAQCKKYCGIMMTLAASDKMSKAIRDGIELLTLLIETYDTEYNTIEDADPIDLMKALMKSHKMKAVDLASLLQVSEGLVSDMLKYKKGLCKDTIRILAEKFKLSQEAFNRPYALRMPA